MTPSVELAVESGRVDKGRVGITGRWGRSVTRPGPIRDSLMATPVPGRRWGLSTPALAEENAPGLVEEDAPTPRRGPGAALDGRGLDCGEGLAERDPESDQKEFAELVRAKGCCC